MHVIQVEHTAAGLAIKVFNDEPRLGAAAFVADDLEKVAATFNLHMQLFFDQAQMGVQLPDQFAEAAMILRAELESESVMFRHNQAV